MIKTLQKRFIFSAMIAITILLIVLLGAINVGNIFISRHQSERMLEVLLNEEMMMQPPPKNQPKGFWDFPMGENSKMSAVYFTIRVDQFGTIIKVDTRRIADVSEQEAIELYRMVISRDLSDGRIQGFRYRAAKSERDGSKIYLFLNDAMQMHHMVTVLFFSVVAGLVCFLAMLFLVIFISKKAIRPIAENFERQKQFVTDAGHELKTPLAIILSNAEAMELYQGENKWSRNIREQVVRLDGLMQNLLTLAKADERRDMLPIERIAVSALAAESLQMFCEPMKKKELGLSQQIESDLFLKANREQIQRLFSILIDNAVKYSVQGGSIRISLQRIGKSVVFQIENACKELPGCPPEKLFDRFYRADTARTQKNGGYGIGLSAAKTIVEFYGGTIKASYSRPNTIIFTVTFA